MRSGARVAMCADVRADVCLLLGPAGDRLLDALLYSYGLYDYGLYSYGLPLRPAGDRLLDALLYSYGLYNCGLYSYGLPLRPAGDRLLDALLRLLLLVRQHGAPTSLLLDHLCHNYIDHNYMGHNYMGPQPVCCWITCAITI